MPESTPLSGGNAAYLESLYDQYRRDPGTVPVEWREYFGRLAEGQAAEPVTRAALPADTAARTSSRPRARRPLRR